MNWDNNCQEYLVLEEVKVQNQTETSTKSSTQLTRSLSKFGLF